MKTRAPELNERVFLWTVWGAQMSRRKSRHKASSFFHSLSFIFFNDRNLIRRCCALGTNATANVCHLSSIFFQYFNLDSSCQEGCHYPSLKLFIRGANALKTSINLSIFQPLPPFLKLTKHCIGHDEEFGFGLNPFHFRPKWWLPVWTYFHCYGHQNKKHLYME